MKQWNSRKTMYCFFILSIIFLVAVTIIGYFSYDKAMVVDFSRKNLPPSFSYPFGTDWMGRDMFARTMTGISMSIMLGFLAAAVSAVIAFSLGIIGASMGKAADGFVSGVIDLVMGIPHILLLVLISFALGKGFKGVITGIAMTHWTSLARLIRGEVLQLKESQYIKIAEKLGHGKLKTAVKHMTPHLLPQILVGFVLLFPHAILHEAGITFLGFGLPPEQPAVGIILSEGMKYLTMGSWWLALFPGLLLTIVVVLFHLVGDTLGRLIDPGRIHQ
ncbi:ABC transporter permease [Aminipila sp.]|uniref:ABC transporter permease n=1 Tax=Aminipila sp. TaxID=2060095 RepID=UPI00289E343A|nr:ABC transporter permease [Aminipila sp.]